MADAFLRLEGITKRYGGVTALADVDFACSRGAVQAVLGENGAGKSTLMKVIAGVVQPDAGRVFVEGREVRLGSPAEALRHGIGCIFQELSLIPDLSVADNLFIHQPPLAWGLIDRREQRRRARQLLAEVGCDGVDPDERVKHLSLARRQLVEIAKVLGRHPKLMILDEATSALPAKDVEHLYGLMRHLCDQGLGVLYISHRMQEMKAIADVCSVFRNGRRIDTFPAAARSVAEIITMMIGRKVSQAYPTKRAVLAGVDDAAAGHAAGAPPQTAPVLTVRNLSWGHALRNVSFDLRPGEIVGLGGLAGQGQTELLLALFGVLRNVEGEVAIGGACHRIRHPAEAKSGPCKLALIPEDRKTQGLLLSLAVRDNLLLAAGDKVSRAGLIDPRLETRTVSDASRQLGIKAYNPGWPVSTLSGGNQQKVVVGKWLLTDPRVLLLNDPTRGIDVGTKEDLYRLLRRLADEGKAILLYTTDYEELIGLCDRVLIFYGGAVTAELAGAELNEYNVLSYSLQGRAAGVPATANDPVTSPSNGRFAGAARRSVLPRVAGPGPWAAAVTFAVMFALFLTHQSRPVSIDVLTTASNKGTVLALIAIAQTLPVLTGGLDLSIGMSMTLAGCLASVVVTGSPAMVALGVGLTLGIGLTTGLINAAVIVFGRIQPIIATLATGAIYLGVALWLRPTPGGDVSDDLSNALTYNVGGLAPTTLLLLAGIAFLVWVPLKRTSIGRGCYAVGSNETAAYMSGVGVMRSKFFAYGLAGVLSAAAGLLLALIALSGEASGPQAESYTLNSIAAVVLGGTSLFGGSGGIIGSILGAFVLRTIGDLLFVFRAPALWQPLFAGLVLLGAVCLGAAPSLRKRNHLDIFQ